MLKKLKDYFANNINLTYYISEFSQISKSKTGKDSIIVLSGNIFGAGLGFLASVLITRTLGPAQFGIFSIAMTVMMIAAQFSDFGIGVSLVRFFSLFHKKDELRSNLVLKVALKFELIVAALIFLIGFFSSEFLASYVFKQPILSFPLRLAFIGAFGMAMAAFLSAVLQAKQSFKQFALVNLVIPAGKFVLIGLLFLIYKLNLLSALTATIILPFIAFIINFLIIPKGFLKAKGDEKGSFKELFRFSKWILISVFCCMMIDRLNVLMLGYFKTPEEVGHYSAAYTFAFIFPLITGTITTVLFPKISAISQKDQLRRYVKKAIKFTAPIIFPIIILLFISRPLILFIYGPEYLSSATVFQIILCGFAFSVIANPIGLAIYSLNKPEVPAYLNILQLILNFVGNLFLIPPFGAIGAASVLLSVKLLAMIYMSVAVYRYTK